MNYSAIGRGGRALLAVCIVLLAAGCAGLGGSPGADEGAGGTQSPAATADAQANATASTTTASGDAPDANESASESDGASSGSESATANESDGREAADSEHGHEHGDGESEGAGDGAGEGDGSESASGDATGEMTVVVAGEQLRTADEGSQGAGFQFGSEGQWRASGDVTLAEALSTVGVDASADVVRYDGRTYRASDAGTSLHFRVNGEEVDPRSYALQDGDEVWVTVETAETDVDPPGKYIDADRSHVHGTIEFVVDGETVDFSRDEYQGRDAYFHFEDGDGSYWHAHTWAMTIEYAMGTLPGITVQDGALTYGGESYSDSDAGTTVTVEVNGEPVNPEEYFLKDGDHVRIVAERSDG
ncbi:hypothetical protein [Halegenticoccus soli]|uniref:hypothetical protein n=1 Tax=Halegenticoccus soli TaxID=1985678 RepID=UPI000C6CB7D5|nr:hypothetical protein [Halegenticoccus soli]